LDKLHNQITCWNIVKRLLRKFIII
jgi:hypothetical protein